MPEDYSAERDSYNNQPKNYDTNSIDITRSIQSQESKAIESLEKGKFVRLHLRFSSHKELCVKYEQQPYLQQLPAKSRILTQSDRTKIEPVQTVNYVLSIVVEAGINTVDLTELKGGDYPITLYYIKSTTEKFNTDYPYSILMFNCPHSILSPQLEKLILRVSLHSDVACYQGNIPVSFKVNHIFESLIEQNRGNNSKVASQSKKKKLEEESRVYHKIDL